MIISFHSAAAKAAFIRAAVVSESEIEDQSIAAIKLNMSKGAAPSTVEAARNSPHVYQIKEGG